MLLQPGGDMSQHRPQAVSSLILQQLRLLQPQPLPKGLCLSRQFLAKPLLPCRTDSCWYRMPLGAVILGYSP